MTTFETYVPERPRSELGLELASEAVSAFAGNPGSWN